VAQVNDLSRSLTAFDPISTLVVVVEMSEASWLVSGVVPGVERQPLKKLEPDATALLRLIERWRSEAIRAGRPINRIALAYEAGRDGFWLARGLMLAGSRPMSSNRRALRYHASASGRRRIVWMRRC
jgi:transposase